MSKSLLRHVQRHVSHGITPLRPFTTSRTQRIDNNPPNDSSSALEDLLAGLRNNYTSPPPGAGPSPSSSASSPSSSDGSVPSISTLHVNSSLPAQGVEEPHHLHCFSTRHNTHVTLTRPNGNPLLSLSCGNLGFRKGGRGSYEAAFQLSSYAMRMMQERGLFDQQHDNYIRRMEVTLRGFGDGRNAFVSALMGVEGRLLRPKIVKLSDATRLKIGGTRSQNPRRLG